MIVWKTHPIFTDYEIADEGMVRNKKTKRELKPYMWGLYWAVALCKDHKVYCRYIHRLVAETFIENPNNYPVVNHKDEDKLNNRMDNLEWCSYSYNSQYSIMMKKKKREEEIQKCYTILA